MVFRIALPIQNYRRLKAQGVVFNTRRFALLDDMVAKKEYTELNPFTPFVGHLIKHTNNLDKCPPIYGVFFPVSTLVFIASADLLEDVYVKQNAHFTKD